MKLENVFLSASSVKEADGRTISLGIPAYTLMGNAANEVYGCINNRQINTSSVVILCGRGETAATVMPLPVLCLGTE